MLSTRSQCGPTGHLVTIDTRYLVFGDMSQSIKLIDCDQLIEYFPLIFPGWPIVESSGSDQSPVITIKRKTNAYQIDGYWLDKPMHRNNKDDAICGLVAELMRAYVRDDPQLLCLHGAAAIFSGKLVVFPSNYRAGKSILCAALASAGVQLFCDDVLPVSLAGGEGIAPGLALRLRLPLPANLSRITRKYIESRIGLEGKQYLYLEGKDGEFAPRGQQAPIGAFVLLQRETGVTPVFERVSEAEVLRQVVWQNFAREAEAPHILEVLSQHVTNSQCYRLHYENADQAASFLKEEFGNWPPDKPGSGKKVVAHRPGDHAGKKLQPGYHLRSADISIVSLDDQSFLADRQGATIHHLNTIGTAVWTLLADPMTLDELVEVLRTAYPDIEFDIIKSDVIRLLGELAAKNLVVSE